MPTLADLASKESPLSPEDQVAALEALSIMRYDRQVFRVAFGVILIGASVAAVVDVTNLAEKKWTVPKAFPGLALIICGVLRGHYYAGRLRNLMVSEARRDPEAIVEATRKCVAHQEPDRAVTTCDYAEELLRS